MSSSTPTPNTLPALVDAANPPDDLGVVLSAADLTGDEPFVLIIGAKVDGTAGIYLQADEDPFGDGAWALHSQFSVKPDEGVTVKDFVDVVRDQLQANFPGHFFVAELPGLGVELIVT